MGWGMGSLPSVFLWFFMARLQTSVDAQGLENCQRAARYRRNIEAVKGQAHDMRLT